MQKKYWMKSLLAAGCTVALAACAHNHKSDGSDMSGMQGATSQSQQAGVVTQGVNSQPMFNGKPLMFSATSDKCPVQASDCYFFAFDKSNFNFTLNGDAQNSLKQQADFLVAHPNVHVLIVGHADQRGSAEYNVVLSERRARTVENALLANGGVTKDQVRVLGMGKENPWKSSMTEESFTKNRRVDMVYSSS